MSVLRWTTVWHLYLNLFFRNLSRINTSLKSSNLCNISNVNIDNKYYGFDLTWDDPVGSGDNLEYNYFAKGKNSDFLSGHVPSITDDFTQKLNFLYALPELATFDKPFVEFI